MKAFQDNSFPLVKYCRDILILLLLSVSVSFIYNYFSPSGIALVGSWDKSKGVISAQEKDSFVKRDREINTLTEMNRIVKENTTVLIDVRPADTFNQGHIPGARSIPLSEYEEFIGSLYETVAIDHHIVVYCAGRECTDSHSFAAILNDIGYENVQVYAGGFSDWEQGGMKIEKN